MSCKKNKIIENAPPGYYICDYTLETGFFKTPVIAFVYYFNNSQNDEELITTNYLTIYSSNYCYRNKSNYNYLIHPDGLVYPINVYDSIGLSEEEFIERRKIDYDLNNSSNTEYNSLSNNSTNTDYINDIKPEVNTNNSTNTDYINENYKLDWNDNYNLDWNENYKLDWNDNYNLDWNYNNSIKNNLSSSHLTFEENKEVLYFNSMEQAGDYCFKNKYSSLNSNISFNNNYYNVSTYSKYVLFFGNSYSNDQSVFSYYPPDN